MEEQIINLFENIKIRNMEDTLVGFKVAKLAKEKGFDIPVIYGYQNDTYKEESLYVKDYEQKHCYNRRGNFSAPTQSLLQKWLREKHKINVYVFEKLVFKGDLNEHRRLVCNIDLDEVAYFSILTPYEEVLEKGLQEALKLIKNECS